MAYEFCKLNGKTMTLPCGDCSATDEWDEPDYLCENIECRHHEAHCDGERKDRIDRFKSSEFGGDILRRMSVVFGIPVDAASKKLEDLFEMLQRDSNNILTDLVSEAMQAKFAQGFDAKARDMVDGVFQEALDRKMLMIEKDGDPTIESLQAMIAKKATEAVSRIGKSQGRNSSTNMDEAINRMVGSKVDAAIKELVKDWQDQFNKAAMKRMMEGMVKAIADDKRLLAVVGQ